MTFALKGAGGTGSSASSNQASLALTTATTAGAAGDLAVLIIACDNYATGDGDESTATGNNGLSAVTGVTSAGGTWQKAGEFCNGQGSAQTGVTVNVWYMNLTGALATGSTVTISFSNQNSRDATAASLTYFTKAANTNAFMDVAPTTLANDAAAPGSMNGPSTDGSTSHLRIRATGTEYNTSTNWTKTAAFTAALAHSYTASGGAAANVGVRGEYVVSTSATVASAPTFNVSQDHASIYVVFKEQGIDALSVSALTSDVPVLGAPNLVNTVAAALTNIAPVLGPATFTQNHILSASALANTQEVPAPAFTEIYPLSASALLNGAPTLGAPELSEELIAAELTNTAPGLDAPAIAIVLTAADLVDTSPVLGGPALTSGPSLTHYTINVETGYLNVGLSNLIGIGRELTADYVSLLASFADTVTIEERYNLVASLTIGDPVLGAPSLSENAPTQDNLTAADLEVMPPVIGGPTNYIAFDLNDWSPSAVTKSGDKIVEDGTLNEHYVNKVSSVFPASLKVTISAVMKSDGRHWAYLAFTADTEAFCYGYIDLDAGSAGTVGGGSDSASSTVTSRGGGWWQLDVTLTAAVAMTQVNANIGLATSDGGTSYSGDGLSGIDVQQIGVSNSEVSALPGLPSLSQGHALSASELIAAAPTLGAPSLGQEHILVASDLTAGSPPPLDGVLLEQHHVLTITGLKPIWPVAIGGVYNYFNLDNYVPYNATVSTDVADGPAGPMTADKIIEDTNNNSHGVYKQLHWNEDWKTISGHLTFWIELKAAERSWFRAEIYDVETYEPYWGGWVDVGNKAWGTATSSYVSRNIVDLGDGWARYEWTFDTADSSGGSAVVDVFLYLALADNGTSYTGSVGSGILVGRVGAALGDVVDLGPALTQQHILSSTGLTNGTSVLGAPSLSENAPNQDNLTAANLVNTTPVLDAPVIGQVHVLSVSGLISGPLLGVPLLTENGTLNHYTLSASSVALTIDMSNLLTFGRVITADPIELTVAFADTVTVESTVMLHADTIMLTVDVSDGQFDTVLKADTIQLEIGVADSLSDRSMSADTVYLTLTGEPAGLVKSGSNAVTASGLTNAAPSLGAPSFGQVHVLSAAGLLNGAPILGAPALGKVLTAATLVNVTPVLGAPSVIQKHVLTAGTLTNGIPELGDPIFIVGQATILDIPSVFNPAPVLGAPALGQTHNLTAAALSNTAPAYTSVTMNYIAGLVATAITANAPVFGSFDFRQVHILTATAITVDVVVPQGVLGQIGSMSAVPLTVGVTIPAPALHQKHLLSALELINGVPAFGSPILHQRHTLTAAGLSVTGPVIGAGSFAEIGRLTVVWTAPAPLLGSPAFGQGHTLSASGLTAGVPYFGQAAFSQVGVMAIVPVEAGLPVLGTPQLQEVFHNAGLPLVNGNPILGAPALGQRHTLRPANLVVNNRMSALFLRQRHVLGARSLSSGMPIVPAPVLEFNYIPLYTTGRELAILRGRRDKGTDLHGIASGEAHIEGRTSMDE